MRTRRPSRWRRRAWIARASRGLPQLHLQLDLVHRGRLGVERDPELADRRPHSRRICSIADGNTFMPRIDDHVVRCARAIPPRQPAPGVAGGARLGMAVDDVAGAVADHRESRGAPSAVTTSSPGSPSWTGRRSRDAGSRPRTRPRAGADRRCRRTGRRTARPPTARRGRSSARPRPDSICRRIDGSDAPGSPAQTTRSTDPKASRRPCGRPRARGGGRRSACTASVVAPYSRIVIRRWTESMPPSAMTIAPTSPAPS